MTDRILVVCTGNICRSAMAEVVLREHGSGIAVSSAGMSDEEQGNPIDTRAADVLAAHGYSVPDHTARRVSRSDLDATLILAMTRAHLRALLALGADPERTRLWTDFVPDARHPDVADPWYGGPADFAETLETVEAAVPQILAALRA